MGKLMYCACGWWGIGTGLKDDTCPMCGGFLTEDNHERATSKSIKKRRKIQREGMEKSES